MKLFKPAEHTFNENNVDGDRLTKYLNYAPGYPQPKEYTPKHGMKLTCLDEDGEEVTFRWPHDRFYLTDIYATYKYKLAQAEGVIPAPGSGSRSNATSSSATPIVEEVQEDDDDDDEDTLPTPIKAKKKNGKSPHNPGSVSSVTAEAPVTDADLMDVVVEDEAAPPPKKAAPKPKKDAPINKKNGSVIPAESKQTPAQLLDIYNQRRKASQELLDKHARNPGAAYFRPTPVPPTLGEQLRQGAFPEQLDLQCENLQALGDAMNNPGYAGPALDSIDLINALLYITLPLDVLPQFFIRWLHLQSAGSGFHRSDTNHDLVVAHLRNDRDETRSGLERELEHLTESNTAFFNQLLPTHPHMLQQLWVLRHFILAVERIYAIRPVTITTGPVPRCALTGTGFLYVNPG